jgi:hypothetical protein
MSLDAPDNKSGMRILRIALAVVVAAVLMRVGYFVVTKNREMREDSALKVDVEVDERLSQLSAQAREIASALKAEKMDSVAAMRDLRSIALHAQQLQKKAYRVQTQNRAEDLLQFCREEIIQLARQQ